MTGILPIKKYGTHSALNMFTEFSMEHPDQMAQFVGFTEEETKNLCLRYGMDFDECRAWYDGYAFPRVPHIYSPKRCCRLLWSTVVSAVTGTRRKPTEALQVYIDLNEDGLRDAVVKMMGAAAKKLIPEPFKMT